MQSPHLICNANIPHDEDRYFPHEKMRNLGNDYVLWCTPDIRITDKFVRWWIRPMVCNPLQSYPCLHDDVIKWKHFPRYWPFMRGIHRSPVNFPHKGQWRRALMFSLICVWINGWENNRGAGDFRRYRAHYDAIVMYELSELVSKQSKFADKEIYLESSINKYRIFWQKHRIILYENSYIYHRIYM